MKEAWKRKAKGRQSEECLGEEGTPLQPSTNLPEDAGSCHGDESAGPSQHLSPTVRKLQFSKDILKDVLSAQKESMIIISESVYLENFTIKCQECEVKSTERPTVSEYKGAAFKVSVKCDECKKTLSVHTSSLHSSHGKYEVNVRLVEFALQENGYATLQAMSKILDTRIPSKKTFFVIAKEIEKKGIQQCEETLMKVREFIHNSIELQDQDASEIKDIAVSCDGSWSKRGFTSKYGVVSVIHLDTGFVIDYETLSKYCKICESHKDDDDESWFEEHKDVCQKNFDGSSPAMEAEGWQRLWGRSVDKCKFRYTTVVSDGDSKAFTSVSNMKPYGEDVEILKEECMNHASKRVGKALRDFVQQKSRERKGVSGKKLGSLTGKVIGKLQDYYFYAILYNLENLEDMKRAIFASLYHCSSTDDAPTHHLCPPGDESWCFFKQAEANGTEPESHEVKRKTYIRVEIRKELEKIYEKYSSQELLSRFTGKTQNANESLHHVLWAYASKTVFYGHDRLRYLISKGIMQFNHGNTVPGYSGMGEIGMAVAVSKDKDRIRTDVSVMQQKEERRSKRRRRLEEEVRKRREEGTTYEAGGF